MNGTPQPTAHFTEPLALSLSCCFDASVSADSDGEIVESPEQALEAAGLRE
jgi:hypothetical protein